jgi:branched-chain amino acid transport system substrate-binding protein
MLKSRAIRTLAIVAGISLVAAACGDDDGSSDTTQAATTAAATSVAPDTTAPAGVTCENVTIASQGPLTGDAAGLGKPITQGAELAVTEFNAANPGCQVKYQAEDSQGDPAQAPAIAKKLVDQADVLGVVGPAFSGESDATGPTYTEAGLVTVSPSATRVDLTTKGYTSFHRVLGTDGVQGPGIARHIVNVLKPAKAAVIDDASAYGKGLADIVAEALGDKVAVTDTIDPKAQDYSAAVTKVADAGVDVVFFGGYYEAAGRLAKQLRDGGVTAQLVFGDGVKDAGFITAAGPEAAEGATITCTCADAAALPAGADFVAAYTAKYGEAPGTYAAEAYDAANLLLSGIAAGNLDRASLMAYVKGASFQGITKLIKFTPVGEVDSTTTYAYVVEGGAIVGKGEIPA